MIQREVLNEIKKWIGEEKILILKGTRQVGKTTLMRQIQDDLEKNGKKTYFFNIDEEIGNPIFQDVKYFIKYLQDQIVFENGKKVYIFIDEFQYLKEAGLFLKILFDKFKKEIQFIVSGSSSLEITKNSEFLTGRKIEFFIKHLSFFEYINYKSQNKYTYLSGENKEDLRIFCDIYKNDIMLHFLDYINYSGYPEICLHDNISQKKQILKELINTYIKKDIIHFLRIENINAFNNLIYLLSSQIGNLVNKNELANTLNINYETIIRYLDILKGTYLFHYIPPYYSNIRKEISKMPKVFIHDIGIGNNILSNFYSDLDVISGNIIENFIFNELTHKFDSEDIFYYRTIAKSEIDFIVKTQNGFIPIEVKYRNKTGNIPLSIHNFEKNYPKVFKKILITKDELVFEGNNYKIPFYLFPFISEIK